MHFLVPARNRGAELASFRKMVFAAPCPERQGQNWLRFAKSLCLMVEQASRLPTLTPNWLRFVESRSPSPRPERQERKWLRFAKSCSPPALPGTAKAELASFRKFAFPQGGAGDPPADSDPELASFCKTALAIPRPEPQVRNWLRFVKSCSPPALPGTARAKLASFRKIALPQRGAGDPPADSDPELASFCKTALAIPRPERQERNWLRFAKSLCLEVEQASRLPILTSNWLRFVKSSSPPAPPGTARTELASFRKMVFAARPARDGWPLGAPIVRSFVTVHPAFSAPSTEGAYYYRSPGRSPGKGGHPDEKP